MMLSNTSTIFADCCKRIVLEQGAGLLHPNEGSKCSITVQLTSGSQYDTQYTSNVDGTASDIVIGEADKTIDCIVEYCLCDMKEGATSLVKFSLDKKHNLISSNSETLHLDPNNVELKITLHSFESATEIWKMDCQEILDKVLHHKSCGSELFNSGDVTCAFRRFCKAAKLLISMGGMCDVENACQGKLLTCQVFLNLAACHTKCSDWTAVVWTCGKVLEVDTKNLKALYRRAVAYSSMMQYDDSIQDLLNAQNVDPSNTAVKNELIKVGAARRTQEAGLASEKRTEDANLASAMSKMFD